MWSRSFQVLTWLVRFVSLPGTDLSHDESVTNADNLTLRDRFARCGFIVDTLFQPQVEALKGLVGIVGTPQLLVVISQVRGQDPRVVIVKVTEESERDCSGVAHEGFI